MTSAKCVEPSTDISDELYRRHWRHQVSAALVGAAFEPTRALEVDLFLTEHQGYLLVVVALTNGFEQFAGVCARLEAHGKHHFLEHAGAHRFERDQAILVEILAKRRLEGRVVIAIDGDADPENA